MFAITAPAAGAGGGPLIPSAAWGGEGVVGPSGSPSAGSRYVALNGGARGTTVARVETDGGAVRQARWFDETWALPAVTLLGAASGLAADERTLVLIKPDYRLRTEETTLLILAAKRLQTRERLHLDGRFSFDAISPDGKLLYLVQYPDPRDPLDYRVRAYDLAAGEFRPGRIVDPEEPEEQMSGQPVARGTSADGRWAYTLYGGEETFIHALDTGGATAVCVDLEQFTPRDLYRLGLAVDPSSGLITVLERGAPAAIVDPQTFSVGEPPAADVAGALAAGTAESAGTSSIAWVAIGGGAALICAVLLLIGRRRRTHSDADEQALELLLRVASDERERDRSEREPVH